MAHNKKDAIKRGEVLYLSVEKGIGSEQFGARFCVCIQNSKGNKYSPTLIVAFITTIKGPKKTILPMHVLVNSGICGLTNDSTIMLEQLRTVDKRRVSRRHGCLPKEVIDKMNEALLVSVMEEEKGIIEKLPISTRNYILNKLQLIDSLDTSIEVSENIGVDSDYIKLTKNSRIDEILALVYYCAANNLNYKEICEEYEKLKENKLQKLIAI